MKKQKLEKKVQKGITLIALVVTIVVLLILAGVSIIVLWSDNGIIKQTQNSSLQTKLAEVEEKANIAYADLNTKKYEEGNPNKVITMADIKKELEKQKYNIKEIQLSESAITQIELEPKNIKIGKGETANINVIFQKNNENLAYYAEIEEKYYQISIENNHICVDKVNGKTKEELEKQQPEGTLDATVDNDIVKIIEKTNSKIELQAGENTGISKITVTYGNSQPQICEVTVMISKPEESANQENEIITAYGRIDVVWLDKNNNIIEKPNKPILGIENNKMQPIKWNQTEETPADETNEDDDWYEYKEKSIEEGVEGSRLADNTSSRWANAKTNNGSYFVWIPRYAYRITYYEDETSTLPTGYYDGYGMWSAVDGKKKLQLEDGIETVKYNNNLYIVHPAFGIKEKQTEETEENYKKKQTQNLELGGWDNTLTGFWVAKFEINGTDGESLISSIDGKSAGYKTIGQFYDMARRATYGQRGEVDSFDKRTSFMNSHMIKNSEWGAVALLTHSQYGRNGHEISEIFTETLQGVGSINTTSYFENSLQSTTGNLYGIYGMSGGQVEFVSAYNDQDKGGIYNSTTSYWTSSTGLGVYSNSTKYATRYSGYRPANVSAYDIYGTSKTGDAIREVFNSHTGRNWFRDVAQTIRQEEPFMVRGGFQGPQEANGIFYCVEDRGEGQWYKGTRTVLCISE